MIKPSEILADRIHEGYVVPQDVRDLVRTAPGVTQQLYVNSILDSLGKNEPWLTGKLKRTNNPTIPTLDIVLALLDLRDDPESKKGNRRTAIEKFIDREGFADWKDKITSNDALGERGWDFVKSLWKRVVNDKMRADIVSERKKAMDEAPLDFGLFQLPNIPGSSFVARSMWPRVTEHIENTGDFTGKDAALDFGENLLMNVPGGSYTKLLGRIPGVSKVARGAGRVMRDMSRNSPAGAAIAGMGDFIKNITGNAVVPFTMEAVDDIAYDDGEGMDQRADFSIGDAAIGTAINQMVNRGLYKVLGPLITEGSGTVSARSPGVQKLREILNGIGKGSSEPGAALARDARNAVNQPVLMDDMIPVSDVKSWRTGHMDTPVPQNEKEFVHNEAVRTLLDAIDDGRIAVNDMKSLNELGKVKSADKAKEVRKELAEKAKKAEKKYDETNQQLNHDSKEYVTVKNEVNSKPKEQQTKNDEDLLKEHEERLARREKENREAYVNAGNAKKEVILHDIKSKNIEPGLPRKTDAWYIVAPDYNKSSVPSTTLMDVLEENTPELFNYATWSSKGGIKATPGEIIGNVFKVEVPTWLANKAGKAKYTKQVLNYVDPSKKLEKEQEETHEAPLRRAQSSAALKILSTVPGVSAQGREFLEDLRKHPEWIKLGHPEKPSQFNLWLLTEGRDLLENTPLYRPTWDVK